MERERDFVRLSDELVEEIRAARRDIAGLLDEADAPAAARGAEPAGTAKQQDPLEEAELAVVSMALAGTTREEARAHLLTEFGIEDADALLDRAPDWTSENERRPGRRFARRLRARR